MIAGSRVERALVKRVGVLSVPAPSIAARVVTRMWFVPSLWSAPVKQSLPDGASSVSYAWRGRTIDAYEMGHGEKIALLIHGWAGSSLQFQRIAERLSQSGYTAIAIDLPGHGRHVGSKTDIYEMADAVNAVAQAIGPIDLVVTHSLGVMPATLALHEDLDARRFVAVSPGAIPRRAFESFVSMLRVSRKTISHVETGIERRIGQGALDRIAEQVLDAHVPDMTMVIQDRGDRMVPLADATRLSEAWDVPILVTSGLGHNRILLADAVVDAIAEFAVASS